MTETLQRPPGNENAATTLLRIGALLGGAFLLGKIVQHATDSWEGASDDSVEFRAAFKREFRAAHIRQHGLLCTNCGQGVRRRRDLHVDHKRTVFDGGEPWASNAQILCLRCNLRKGRRSGLVGYHTGR